MPVRHAILIWRWAKFIYDAFDEWNMQQTKMQPYPYQYNLLIDLHNYEDLVYTEDLNFLFPDRNYHFTVSSFKFFSILKCMKIAQELPTACLSWPEYLFLAGINAPLISIETYLEEEVASSTSTFFKTNSKLSFSPILFTLLEKNSVKG